MGDKMKSVIIVDDEISFARDIAKLLQEGNDQLRVIAVKSAEEAIKQMESSPVDIVVTDIKLPNMSGIDFAQAIKARWLNTAIIIMTAYGAEDVIKSAFNAGALFYIEKPFKIEKLGNMVKMASLKKQEKTVAVKNETAKTGIEKHQEAL